MLYWFRSTVRVTPLLFALSAVLVSTAGSAPLADDTLVGRTSLLFDEDLFRGLGIEMTVADPTADSQLEGGLGFAVQAGARLSYPGVYPNNEGFSSGSLWHEGGLELTFNSQRVSLIGFELRAAEEPYLFDLYDSEGQRWFRLGSAHSGRSADGSELRFADTDLLLSSEFAAALERTDLEGTFMGLAEISIDAELAQRDFQAAAATSLSQLGQTCDPPNPALDIDVELSGLFGLSQRAREPGVRVVIAPAADLSNVGPGSVVWGQAIEPDFTVPPASPALIADHPYLSLHFYRMVDGRLRQIGQSDIKHAFFAVNSGCSCPAGQVLYPNCSDRYGIGNNTDQLHFAPRAGVTVSTGAWERVGSHFDNFGAPPAEQNDDSRSHFREDHDAFEHLLVVQEPDLLTPNAQYFIEAWYVVGGDIDILNSMGNRRVSPSLVGENWSFPFQTDLSNGSILDQFVDPDFTPNGAASTLVDTGEGSFQLAVNTTAVGESFHYEFALMNFDFDRQISSFTLPLSAGVAVSNPAFNDIDANAANDWSVQIVQGTSITWTAAAGNSLDWGTLFNFAFDANAPPIATQASLTALEPGTALASVAALTPDPMGLLGDNDSCNFPQVVGTGTTLGTLAGATRDGSSSVDFDPEPDVWFQFIPSRTGEVRINTCGSNDSPSINAGLDTVLSLHTSCSGGEIIASDDWGSSGNDFTACEQRDPVTDMPLDQGDPQALELSDSAVSVTLTAGVPVWVRVSRFSAGPDPFRLNIFEPPSNDDFANATAHPGGTLLGSLDQAQPDDPEPDPQNPDFPRQPDVWYRFTPSAPGSVRINTCGTEETTGQDTVISLFDSFMIPLDIGNDDYQWGNDATACDGEGGSLLDSAVALDVSDTNPLLVQVTRFDASSNGGFQLNIDGNPPFEVTIATFPADAETGDYDLVWYGFQAANCVASGSSEFTGARLNGDFQSVNPSVTTQYTLECERTGFPNITGVASTVLERPSNNVCSAPVGISQAAFPFVDSLDTSSASPDPSDPDTTLFCVNAIGPDLATVWYSITPTSSGPIVVDTLASRYDTVLSVWNAAPGCGFLDSASPVACNDDASSGVVQSQVQFDAQAGTTYLIQVGSYHFGDPLPEDAGGSLVLQVPEPAANLMMFATLGVLAALSRMRRMT